MKANFVGIGEASRILGLSRTSLQKLVDCGRLPAVKTTGGHRRLPREAVDELNRQVGPKALRRHTEASAHDADSASARYFSEEVARAGHPPAMSVLLVEDDAATAAMMAGFFEELYPNIVCTVVTDGLNAVLLLERNRPRILITDLNMDPFDGFRLLRLIQGRPEYQSMALVAVSGLSDEEIAQRGGLASNVLLLRKPVNLDRLRGFLDAHVQGHQQMQAV